MAQANNLLSPTIAPMVQRSQYLADALQSLQTGGQKGFKSWGGFGSTLLADAILEHKRKKADEELATARTDEDTRRSDTLTKALEAFGQPSAPAEQQFPASQVSAEEPAQPMNLDGIKPTMGGGMGLSPQDREALANMVYGEARGEPPEGQQAVASVALNRARASGQPVSQVVSAPHQFAGFDPKRTPDPAQLAAVMQNIGGLADGSMPPTTTADHFFAPRGMPGGQAPSWAQGQPAQGIGNHQFLTLNDQGQQPQAQGPAGQTAPGNIDLHKRPIVQNPDGSISTVRSISIGTDRGEVLIPTVVGGRVVSNDDAIRHWRQTGENLGTFKDPASADAYAQSLHEAQAAEYGGQRQAAQQPPAAPQAQVPPSAAPNPAHDQIAMIKTLLADPSTRDLGQQLMVSMATNRGSPKDFGFINLGNGGVARTDPRTGEVTEVIKPGSGGAKRGLVPIYGKDAQGNSVVMFPSEDGTLIQPELPKGVSALTPGIAQQNLGTSNQLINSKSGQVISSTPIDVSGKSQQEAAGQVSGTAQATAAANLANALATGEQSLGVINDLLNSPELEHRTGMMGVLPAIPGTAGVRFDTGVDQIKGQAFLTAFQNLKGAGAITENEGQKATQAIARLDRRQSPADFRGALQELAGVIKLGMERQRAKAAGGAAPQSPAPHADADLLARYGIR